MTTKKSAVSLVRGRGVRRGIGLTSLVVLASASFLAGCSGMSLLNDAPAASVAGATLKGNVHGGQNPVNGSTVQLYAAQAAGYSGAAVRLGAAVATDTGGNFTLGSYTCPAGPNDQIYIVATGGDSGSGPNASLAMMAGLGSCSNVVANVPFITINEVTTVASAYALEGFMADYAHVGTSSTNYLGLQHAMATVNNLVNIGTGVALTSTPGYATPPAGTSSVTFASLVPQAEIYNLANVLSYCVNSNGTNGLCALEFDSAHTNTTTGGVSGVPDTIQAALNIAKNPGINAVAIYTDLVPPSAPFSPVLATAPNDWTIALSFAGGGMGGNNAATDPSSKNLAVDAAGNIWVSNGRQSTVTELDPLGNPISPSTVVTPSVIKGGFSGGGITTPSGLAIDTLGNVWVGNNNGTLSELANNGSPITTSAGYSGGGLNSTAQSIAIDGLNNVWAVGVGAVAEFNSAGTPLSGAGITTNINSPKSVAIDGSNNAWIDNSGNGFVDEFSSSEAFLGNSGNLTVNIPIYSAIDGLGHLWSPQTAQVYVFGPASGGVIPTLQNDVPFSLSNCASIEVDGDDHIWIVSGGGAGGAAINANLTEFTTSGSTITPANGYQGTGNGVLGAGLIVQPLGSDIDLSGNLWLAHTTNPSTVTEFVGVGAPTITPLAQAVASNKIGQRP